MSDDIIYRYIITWLQRFVYEILAVHPKYVTEAGTQRSFLQYLNDLLFCNAHAQCALEAF